MSRTSFMNLVSGTYCDNKLMNLLSDTYCEGTPMDILHGTFDPVADFLSKKGEAGMSFAENNLSLPRNFLNMSVVVLFGAAGVTSIGAGCRGLMQGNNRTKAVAQLTVGVFSSATAFFFANRFNFV